MILPFSQSTGPLQPFSLDRAPSGPEKRRELWLTRVPGGSVYDICPHNDLSELGISSLINEREMAYNNSFSDKCSVLAQPAQCSTFSIETHATTFVNPGALPSGFPGTEPLSNTGGGSITSPGLGATHVFTIFPGYTSTIVAAPYNPSNAAATAGAASPTTSQKSASASGYPRWSILVGGVGVAIMSGVFAW